MTIAYLVILEGRMLKKFLNWAEFRRDSLERIGISTVKIHTSDSTDKPAVYVEHESSTGYGGITIWVTGEMEVEVWNIENVNNNLFQHYDVEGDPDFDSILKDYFLALSTH